MHAHLQQDRACTVIHVYVDAHMQVHVHHAAYGGGPPRFFSGIGDVRPDPETVLKDLSGTVTHFLQFHDFTKKYYNVQNASSDSTR